MKNTLNDQKNRIIALINEMHGTGYPRGESGYKPLPPDESDGLDLDQKLEDALKGYFESVGNNIDEVRKKVDEILDNINTELPAEEEPPMSDTSGIKTGGIPRGVGAMEEQDEYDTKYNKNMSQGFAINEGNAFVGAAKKARKEGKDKFEHDGKTYKVTLKK